MLKRGLNRDLFRESQGSDPCKHTEKGVKINLLFFSPPPPALSLL